MTTVSYRFRLRRGTAANLASVNEVPLEGELVIETDTLKQKLGDGVTAYNSLSYLGGGVTSFNTRTGAVVLLSADVTGALAYTPANKAGDTFTGKVLAPQIDVTGGVSAPAWTTNGVVFRLPASTLTDTTSSGTVATAYGSLFGAQTIAASSATTYTNVFGVWFDDPIAGANVTMSNKFALGAASIRSFGIIWASGAITGAGLTITGSGHLVSSTGNNVTAQVASGATTTGNTKNVQIGANGLSGSITNILIGSGAGTVNIYRSQQAPTSKSAAATLTAAEIAVRLIQYTGAADNLTMPTGTALDTGNAAMAIDTALDFSVVNTGSGTATMTANTGVTIVGAAGVAAGTSGLFRLRKTATATYILYRLA